MVELFPCCPADAGTTDPMLPISSPGLLCDGVALQFTNTGHQSLETAERKGGGSYVVA